MAVFSRVASHLENFWSIRVRDCRDNHEPSHSTQPCYRQDINDHADQLNVAAGIVVGKHVLPYNLNTEGTA